MIFLKNKFAAENLFEFNRSIDQKLPDVKGFYAILINADIRITVINRDIFHAVMKKLHNAQFILLRVKFSTEAEENVVYRV